MDDIRIVKKTLDNFKADGSFEQDFETVVQGLYPFVLSSAQGISDPSTHLSQLNEPYTQAGWGDRVIDDVISNEWSVKHHSSNREIIYQTIPQNLRFERGKVYKVEFDYQSGPDKAYAMVVGDGEKYTVPATEDCLPQARGSEGTGHVEMQVVGSGSGQTWIGLYANGPAGKTNIGETDFVLDNLKITEDKNAVAVSLSKTNLYKGETADIYGSGLEQITWVSSDESVATVGQNGLVKALKKGKTTISISNAAGLKASCVVTVEGDNDIETPTKPSKPTKPSDSKKPTVVPVTGDRALPGTLVMVVTVAGVAVVSVLQKKRGN